MPIAFVARDYPELIGALRERKELLKLTCLDVDDRGQFPSGYAAKLFCGSRVLGFEGLRKMLTALDAELVVVSRKSLLSLAKKEKKSKPASALNADEKYLRWAEWGRKGGVKRACLLSPSRRRQIAKLGGLAKAAKRQAAGELRRAPVAPLRAYRGDGQLG